MSGPYYTRRGTAQRSGRMPDCLRKATPVALPVKGLNLTDAPALIRTEILIQERRKLQIISPYDVRNPELPK